ncbi:MAG: glycosyltransferase family 39 protein [Saccharofermentanales bacterium]
MLKTDTLKYTKSMLIDGSKLTRYFLVAFLITYPLVSSFFGLDLNDTGFYMFNYVYLFKTPEILGFSAFFSNLIGHIWLKLFGFLGLWAMNFLEVLLEYLICLVIYRTFRDLWGEIPTLIGLVIASLSMGTYVNIFNFHQFHVLFLILISCSLYTALKKDKLVYSFLAGVFFAMDIFARLPSITGIVFLLIYLIPWTQGSFTGKRIIRHVLYFMIGTIAIVVFFIILLFSTGLLTYLIDNIFKLNQIARAKTGSYSFKTLLKNIIVGNVDAVLTGIVFFAGVGLLVLGLFLALRKRENRKTLIIDAIAFLLSTLMGILIIKRSYNLTPVKNWAQMSTGPIFTGGIAYIFGMIYLVYFVHYNSRNLRSNHVVAGALAFYIPLLTIIGSSTGFKHAKLAMWLLAPLAVFMFKYLLNQLKDYMSKKEIKKGFVNKANQMIVPLILIAFIVPFAAKFLPFVYHTNNFDSENRLEVTHKINHPKLKYIHTTERQANAMQGALDHLADYPDAELSVFGTSVLYYYLTGRDSYIQPRLTYSTYSIADIEKDIRKCMQEQKELPIFLYSRISDGYGYAAEKYDRLVSREQKNDYSGKKQFFINFLQDNNYGVAYYNDYYMIAVPPHLNVEIDSDASISYLMTGK